MPAISISYAGIIFVSNLTMGKNKIISDLVQLGVKLDEIINNNTKPQEFIVAEQKNHWFTQNAIRFTIAELSKQLTEANLVQWVSRYNLNELQTPKNIGLVLAGNIPLVGFHDILCCLISGNHVTAKLSHKDQDLYIFIKNILIEISDEYEHKITFTPDQLKDIDAIIATGSNNSKRYFEHYFGKYPNIIRSNRNSIAIINEDLSEDDIYQIGSDIFTYFGLGCRNISFLLIPEGYKLEHFIKNIERYSHIIEHNKYANNYSYQRTLLALNNSTYLDNGFCTFTQNESLSSPIGVLHFAYYKNEADLESFVDAHKHEIQCIVSKTKHQFKTYSLGMAQKPELWDYADNIDTIDFLLNLNNN